VENAKGGVCLEASYKTAKDAALAAKFRLRKGEVMVETEPCAGAEGLRALRAKGHHTIAQDQSSSAVYGMPAAAAELDAAGEILSLDKIGPRLTNIVARNIRMHG
jgi:hypothetical protein